MLAKLTLALCVLGALAAAPAAAGDGPLFVTQGGAGLVAPPGFPLGPTRFIPVADYQGNNTELLAISTKDGTELNQLTLVGSWGLSYTPAGAQGISLDGKKLVLADTTSGQSSPSNFMIVNPRSMRIVRAITLPGYFSFDAMSPDGSKLYFIQYVKSGGGTLDLQHYVVRGFDVKSNRLLPGRIADRTQKSWVMQGSPMTRTTSADGRWVYTLYSNPAGYPFIHALDTVRGVAHCVGLPMTNQNGIYNIRLALHGRTLSVHWLSGRPFVNVDTATWRVSPAHRGGFPWWTLAFLAVLPPIALLLRRRCRSGRLEHELAEILRDETQIAELAGTTGR
jgi:DNA-binding beta-propeller fold protein YncE